MQVAIIDYGIGNLRNVQKAFESLHVPAVITQERAVIEGATHIVLPGVGAFEEAMKKLSETGLDHVIKKQIQIGKPFLGICLGMQLLFERGYENGLHKGLGVLKGEVVKLEGAYKVPHMGWNTLEIVKSQPVFCGVKPQSYVYFVHSYHIEAAEDIVSSYTTYGKRFGVSVQKENIYAMQFHPEKSGKVGMQLLKNFINQTKEGENENLSSY